MVISLDSFAVELTQTYPEHKIAPGLQIAWLKDKEAYYVAVHIFPLPKIESRQVIAKAVDPKFQEAVDACYRIWKAIKTQLDALAKDAEMTTGSH